MSWIAPPIQGVIVSNLTDGAVNDIFLRLTDGAVNDTALRP
jgi:hypothetical protein